MSDASWSWLEARKGDLGRMSADAVATVLEEGLASIDQRLGAEVSDVSGTRQVVLTAGGDAEAFPLVRSLVDSAPSLAGFRFVALRPARGFEFEVNAGGLVFEAKALSFQPISSDRAPSQVAIRLLVPNPQLEQWAEIGWQIVESGIGEEAAARIAYLEIGKREDDSDNVFALESLAGYIERHAMG